MIDPLHIESGMQGIPARCFVGMDDGLGPRSCARSLLSLIRVGPMHAADEVVAQEVLGRENGGAARDRPDPR